MDNNLKLVLGEKALHTVMLDPEKCMGCITCMRRCPTEAIRVRDGKASVAYEKCIGCGECVRLCPHHAKLPSHDPWDCINDFKYKIVLPPPSLYGQFNNLEDINYVLNGLLKLGFDEVYEVGKGAEYVSEATNIVMNRDVIPKPVISTACPAVVELIMMSYHNLQKHLLNLLAPVDVAAKIAKQNAIKRGIPEEDIGVYFISPCPAKVFALKMGIGVEKPYVDRVISTADAYKHLLPVMKNLEEIKPMCAMSSYGLGWGISRGEANATFRDKTIAADGIENCKKILDVLEDGGLEDIDFIELNACTGGCVGGVMNVENPFVTRSRVANLMKKLPRNLNGLAALNQPTDYYMWEQNPSIKDVFKLDSNRVVAMQKMMEIENILEGLPKVDCGLCGAPSCKAFAEDIVNGIIPKDSKCPRMMAMKRKK
ncbi:MAG: 4Fe-4S binding protein [Clostridia bacterium]|nr:4Fe-4S binding protein [Clostridia bacterium]